jgi:hypothetical protein
MNAETKRQVEREQAAFARLFPGAPGIERLRLDVPTIGVLAARRWHRVSLAILLTGLWLLTLLQLLAPGGTVLGFGVRWFVLAVVITVIGLAGYLWSARRVRPTGADIATTWDDWAAPRGFRALTSRRTLGETTTMTQSRDYGVLYHGRAGRSSITIGNCYVRDPDGDVRNLGLGVIAAYTQLPSGTADRFPASSLDRFLVGRPRLRLRPSARLRSVRLESIDLDDSCELRVDAGSDDLDWYDLLDPTMVDGIARTWPVSWRQSGRDLVVFLPAPIGTLDAAELDTVCAATAAIARRFTDEAQSPSRAAGSDELSADRLQRQRRFRRIRGAFSWAFVIAIFVVPITVTEHLNSARLEATMARFDRATRSSVTRYAAVGAIHTVQACLQDAIVDETDPARCTHVELPERERIDELLVTRSKDGNSFRVEARDEDTPSYVAVIDAANPEDVTRTCSPVGADCTKGRWKDHG